MTKPKQPLRIQMSAARAAYWLAYARRRLAEQEAREQGKHMNEGVNSRRLQ